MLSKASLSFYRKGSCIFDATMFDPKLLNLNRVASHSALKIEVAPVRGELVQGVSGAHLSLSAADGSLVCIVCCGY